MLALAEVTIFTHHRGVIQFIRDIHTAKRNTGKPVISFEFFPPKTDEGDRALLEKTIPALMPLRPDFCSVTYGASGSTRDKTLMIVERIQNEHNLTAMMHLTCVNATQAELAQVVAEAQARGVKNLLALRGDPPPGTGEFQKTAGGFEFSSELVAWLKQQGGFSIGTAGFPEGHIACHAGKYTDWEHLKRKVDCGADFIVTQLFFDNADFYEFHAHLTKKLGVTVPICPGVLPILSASQVKRFTALCGARLPASLVAQLEKFSDDDAAAMEFGIEYATQQCAELLKFGVPGLHFYTLNKAHSTTRVLQNLGLA